MTQLVGLGAAAISLPLAAALGAALAFRPQRAGTPPRTPTVIHTQIILAIIGATVMLIVGQSLARAFGIAGAASLVRYRAKIDDPKDAGVMLASLGVGLACGVGLYLLAAFATGFVMLVLWWVESIQPTPQKAFSLKVKTPDPPSMRPKLERLLGRTHADFELRTSAADELVYEVMLPVGRRTDQLANAILTFDPARKTAVEWTEKKIK
jgi:uncharacterized membrane protein YhiD involved in acid resistance